VPVGCGVYDQGMADTEPDQNGGAHTPQDRRVTVRLRVRGVVQGVGFRPFVYRIGNREGLDGWVKNDGEGVLIEGTGSVEELDRFIAALVDEAPFAADVESVAELERRAADDQARSEADGPSFVIRASGERGHPTTLISPDLPICPDCLRELFDRSDRRFRYPFINCTNCGPRWSIIESLPYDRPRTTMKAFELCDACAAEYHDPADRRFHAQPVACPDCGPTVRWLDADGTQASRGEDAIHACARALSAGKIVAVKGLGGYHLACDARNAAAVRDLRERKVRKDKPFALMARDLAIVDDTVVLGDEGRALLTSTPTPIVLAPRLDAGLPEDLAPGSGDLGVMLPYTPVHHLLYDAGAPPLLVMTSANRAGEPIAYRDDEALERLGGLADAFLVGDRGIARRVDDSVATVMAGRPTLFRRARGYAPAPVARHETWDRPLLALGAGLKNAVVLATGGYAFVSQHLGDLDDLDVLLAFREAIADLTEMYDVDPREAVIAHDLHPDYPSTRYAEELGGRTIAIQHHEAHIASVAAEHGEWGTRLLGVAFDGAGLGHDRTVWGGELLAGSVLEGFERIGHLRPVPLPGGDAAARTPQQAAVGFLQECEPELWHPLLDERRTWVAQALIDAGVNTPRTSSVGRLFDTVAALCGFRGTMSFEGQAAMDLEAKAWRATEAPRFAHGEIEAATAARALDDGYELPFEGDVWDAAPLLETVLHELRDGAQAERVALRFHAGLARAVTTAVQRTARHRAFDAVALSGGVWQNRLLHELATLDLRRAGFEVWANRAVPLGDGGIALGQAALAGARRGGGSTSKRPGSAEPDGG